MSPQQAMTERDKNPEPQFAVIVAGGNGSGKSTLMHCIAGLDKVNGGEVWLGDTDITRLSEKKLTLIRREKIGFIFQAFNLLPTLNAKENIELPMSLSKKKINKSWFDTVVQTVGLKDRLTHKPSELSGGQQQRVAVARALASEPEIIFADEPTGNLDSKNTNIVFDIFQELTKDFGQTIIAVTHDDDFARKSDRIIEMKDGEIIR